MTTIKKSGIRTHCLDQISPDKIVIIRYQQIEMVTPEEASSSGEDESDEIK
jgi:hypothetical protein